MAKTAKQKLNALFWIIAGVAFASAFFVGGSAAAQLYPDAKQLSLVGLFIVAPLFVESVGAIGLAKHWFTTWFLRPGIVLDVLQWIAGILGVIGIFDIVMRFTRKAAWMSGNITPFAIDGILILLFILWLIVSHLVNKDVKERKVCEFC